MVSAHANEVASVEASASLADDDVAREDGLAGRRTQGTWRQEGIDVTEQ